MSAYPETSFGLSGLSPQRRQLVEQMLRNQASAQPPATAAALSRSNAGPAEGGLRISLFFFSADLGDSPADKYRLVLRCAELADRLGLHAVWVPERHFDPFGAPYPAPAVLLGALAACTSRIGLRAGSVVLPLHDPLLVAEEWGVLDAISDGRMAMSLASGWHIDDFVLDPDAYADRKTVLIERLATLRALWDGKAISRTLPGGRVGEVVSYPRPSVPPEIWLTSSTNAATWKTAGELDLHVLTALLEQSVDDIAAKAAVYHEARAAAGHVSRRREITCMMHTHLAEREEDVPRRVRGPLDRYLRAHLELFAKNAQKTDIGLRPDEVSEVDRQQLVEFGMRRYLAQAGLFGTVDSCRPILGQLALAGVTEVACLVDFGLPDDEVLECVEQLGVLQVGLRREAGTVA